MRVARLAVLIFSLHFLAMAQNKKLSLHCAATRALLHEVPFIYKSFRKIRQGHYLYFIFLGLKGMIGL